MGNVRSLRAAPAALDSLTQDLRSALMETGFDCMLGAGSDAAVRQS